MSEHSTFSEKLLRWFDVHGRKDLPWQKNKSAYRVWVSEIMLQQTQVQAVITYYQRFMRTFPSLQALASAHEDEVLEHWAGLGYYARARNLHKCAKILVDDYSARFPDSVDELLTLPGIGRSTAGAISSIAFKKRAPILDGNVKRVLSRFDGIETWPGERETEKKLWLRAGALSPHERVDDYTQAIMDLGATLCTRSKPDCALCPLQSECYAYEHQLQAQLPVPKPKRKLPEKEIWLAKISNSEGQLLLEKRPPNGIWGGLYSLPEYAIELSLEQLNHAIQADINMELETVRRLPPFSHTFSHYKLHLHPVEIITQASITEVNDQHSRRWVSPDSLSTLGFPAPIKKFLDSPASQQLLALE